MQPDMAMPGQAGGLDYAKRRSDKVNITFDIFLQEIEKTKISLKISGKGELGVGYYDNPL